MTTMTKKAINSAKSANIANAENKVSKKLTGSNVKKDVLFYARKKDGEISVYKMKIAASKELEMEMTSISGAIKQVKNFGGQMFKNLIDYKKLSSEQALTPAFLLANYSKVTNCYFKGSEAWYKYTVKVNGENTTVEKLRSKWSGKLILSIIASA